MTRISERHDELYYVCVHEHMVEDDAGELVDVVIFCSGFCHQRWCQEYGEKYQGWCGCHEHEYQGGNPPQCAGCGKLMLGSEY